MDTKALKKQMGAAIAMVLVAAVALGSATFAWFVTNSKVEATTSKISAQSNAAFMTILKGESGASNADQSSDTTDVADAELYPATFGEQADENSTAHKGLFYTGYGTDTNDGKLKGALTMVGADGAPDTAATNEYAQKEVFNIGTKGQNMKGLKVAGVTNAAIAPSTDAAANNGSSLMKALRILIVDGVDKSKWVVYGQKADGPDQATTNEYEVKLSSENDNKTVPDFGTITAGADHVVYIYLYYEGSDAQIYTNNLEKLASTNAVTVSFTADANGNTSGN